MSNKSFTINQLSNLKKVSKEIIKLTKTYNLFLFEGEMGSGKTTLISSIVSIFYLIFIFNSIAVYMVNSLSTIPQIGVYNTESWRISILNA